MKERENVISTELENTLAEYNDYLKKIKETKGTQADLDEQYKKAKEELENKKKALKKTEGDLQNAKYKENCCMEDIRKEKVATEAYVKEKKD